MRKKILMVALILVLLLVFAASAFAIGGPETRKYGPIVILGHPWGEYQKSAQTPPCYRSGRTGDSSSGFVSNPSVTNFVVEFYTRYVVKRQTEGQTFVHTHGRSE